jgi:hypothetical protein
MAGVLPWCEGVGVEREQTRRVIADYWWDR